MFFVLFFVFASMYICVPQCISLRGQKRVSEPLELELTDVIFLVGTEEMYPCPYLKPASGALN